MQLGKIALMSALLGCLGYWAPIAGAESAAEAPNPASKPARADAERGAAEPPPAARPPPAAGPPPAAEPAPAEPIETRGGTGEQPAELKTPVPPQGVDANSTRAPAASGNPPPAELKPPGPQPGVRPEQTVQERFAVPQPMNQAPEMDAPEPPYSGPLGSHQQHFILWLGLRNDYVRDERFDMFASNDSLVAFSMGVGSTVFSAGNLSLAALGIWETGSREAEARGDATKFRVHRFELAPEVRYHLHYRAFAFARLGLGTSYVKALRHSQLAATDRIAKDWLLATDLTLGGAFRLFGDPSGQRRAPRVWFIADGGYALTSSMQLEFEPDPQDSSSPERSQPQDLGSLNLRAPLFRLAVAGTY